MRAESSEARIRTALTEKSDILGDMMGDYVDAGSVEFQVLRACDCCGLDRGLNSGSFKRSRQQPTASCPTTFAKGNVKRALPSHATCGVLSLLRELELF
jgi:hypothetical protein